MLSYVNNQPGPDLVTTNILIIKNMRIDEVKAFSITQNFVLTVYPVYALISLYEKNIQPFKFPVFNVLLSFYVCEACKGWPY